MCIRRTWSMAVYIDRDALLRELLARGFLPAVVRRAILSIPPARVAAVTRGHWIRCGDGYVCSECQVESHGGRYCPECGAWMRDV